MARTTKRREVRVLGDAPRARTDRFRPNPGNDNRESSFMYGKLKATILAEGFAQPLVVRSGDERGAFADGMFEIIGGEHRWRAMQELGAPEISYHDVGHVSDVIASKLLINLNHVRGESDSDALSALVRKVAEGGEDALASLAIDHDALADLLDGDVPGFDEPVPGATDMPEDLGDAAGVRVSPRDLLVLLGMDKIDKGNLARVLDGARAWARARPDQERPAWLDMVVLMAGHTPSSTGD